MSDSAQIRTDTEMKAALFQLFALANMQPPADVIAGSDVLMALHALKTQLKAATVPSRTVSNHNEPQSRSASPPPADPNNPFAALALSMGTGGASAGAVKRMGESILIVGELGIVTYQLKLSLSKIGMNVTIVRGIDEAITEYQKRSYTGALIDIFMPTEREGLLVLAEIKRMQAERGIPTDIVVLATPVKEKGTDLKDHCCQQGAALYLEKSEGWHQKVIDFFTGQYEPD